LELPARAVRGDVPSADELAAMPALVEEALLPRRWPELSRAEREAARPFLTKLFNVATTSKAETFGPHVGEVVARNVDRSRTRHPGRQALKGHVWIWGSTWPELAEWIAEPEYKRAVDLTRATMQP
jgi:hypothetical protein